MKLTPYRLLHIFSFLLVITLASCDTSAHISKSKYSSVGKREKKDRARSSNTEYTRVYKKANHKEKSESTTKLSEIREEIVESAKKYQGTPYTSGGKSPESGFDCSGFAGYVFTKNGIPLAGSSDQMATKGKQIDRYRLLPGDLVFFGNDDRISHVGIVADNLGDALEVIHSTTSAGVKIDNIKGSEYWDTRFLFGIDIISK